MFGFITVKDMIIFKNFILMDDCSNTSVLAMEFLTIALSHRNIRWNSVKKEYYMSYCDSHAQNKAAWFPRGTDAKQTSICLTY